MRSPRADQLFPTSAAGSTLLDGSFQLIDDSGNLVTPTAGTVTSVTLSGECDPAVRARAAGTNLPPTCSGNETPDPLFDATDATAGGGDTGSVLISPYITPGHARAPSTTTTTTGCGRWRTSST